MKSASKALAISNRLIDQHERTQREATINTFLDMMRARGASQQSLQTALTGFNEYLRITNTSSPRRTSPEAQPDQPSSDPPTQDDTALPLSEILTEPLTWLWSQRIPMGKLTLLDGEPGSGTSLLALTIAACISSGLPLPADSSGTGTRTTPTTPPRNVLLIAPRDHAGDTIKPRLLAAGGDPSHLFLLNSVETAIATPTVSFTDRPFCLADDLDLLEATIKRLQVVLVIIDPLHAVLGRPRTRSSASAVQSTSSLLASLDQLAQSTGCAFLLVRPVRTSRSDLRRPRPTGSLDQTSVARSGLLVTCDPEDEDTRLLLPTKHSLCQLPPVLSYEIVEHPSGAPVILWLGTWQDSQSPASTLSAQRQAILAYLLEASLPMEASSIASGIGYGYERVRKMLQRMLKEGKLVSPARGLYTTPGHPGLAEELRFLYIPEERSNLSSHPTSTDEATSPDTISSPNAAPDLPEIPGEESTQNDASPSVPFTPVPNVPTMVSATPEKLSNIESDPFTPVPNVPTMVSAPPEELDNPASDTFTPVANVPIPENNPPFHPHCHPEHACHPERSEGSALCLPRDPSLRSG